MKTFMHYHDKLVSVDTQMKSLNLGPLDNFWRLDNCCCSEINL